MCKDICRAFGANEVCCRDNVLSFKEHGRKLTLQLPPNSTDTVCSIHVDDCLIQNKTRLKCDYWLRHCRVDNYQNYFVEFKGGDISHAFKQIISTIEQISEKGIVLPKNSIHGVIIARKVPSLDAGTQILKSRFSKDYGADLCLCSSNKANIKLKQK